MLIKKAPLEIFKKTVQYFPTFSVNIILLNKKGEFLLVKRKSNPAKGLYYLPGGRILNGETVGECAQRMLTEELSIKGDIKHVSREYAEEIWPTKDFKGEFGPYTKETKNVHYLSTTVVVDLKKDEKIKVDYQSEEFAWFRELPSEPIFLRSCFVTAKDYLEKAYSIRI